VSFSCIRIEIIRQNRISKIKVITLSHIFLLLLAESESAFYEPRFDCDFSQVRVHTDHKMAESARAFTVGQYVVFGPGQFSSGSSTGKRLLAHELTHVMQQDNSHPGSIVQH
jgi:uncharacterized protein DUF4157